MADAIDMNKRWYGQRKSFLSGNLFQVQLALAAGFLILPTTNTSQRPQTVGPWFYLPQTNPLINNLKNIFSTLWSHFPHFSLYQNSSIAGKPQASLPDQCLLEVVYGGGGLVGWQRGMTEGLMQSNQIRACGSLEAKNFSAQVGTADWLFDSCWCASSLCMTGY